MSYEIGKFNIDTPEQVMLEFSVAGIGSRFLAVLVDSLIQALAALLIILVGVGVAATSKMSAIWAGAVAIFFGFIIYWGYFAGFEAIWKGQTPGKRVLKIRVIKNDGRSINFYDAMARNLLRFVDFLPSGYGVGMICMFIDSKNRRLGDLVAGTIVVHAREQAGVDLSYEPLHAALATGDPVAFDVRKLGPDHLAMIERFLSRRLDIEYFARQAMGEKLALMIRQKLGITAAEQAMNDEDFLQTVARALRDTAAFH
jgi:uncharacterized RDD family membrane protein YckC